MPPFRAFITRHETSRAARVHAKAVAGLMVGLLLVGAIASLTGLPLLLAPLAPTALLIFSQPESPAAQPANIFAGYFIGAMLAALSETYLPGSWWAASLAAGTVMAVMLGLRVTHPPAAAVPLVTLAAPQPPHLLFLVMLLGCIVLVAVGVLHHSLPPRTPYPRLPQA